MAQATTNSDQDFAVGSVGDDATHWTLWDASSGGNLLWSAALDNDPDALTANQFYRVEAGDITITLAIGSDGATEEAAQRCLEGLIDTATYLQLHSGAPGSSGTDNVLTSTRVEVTESEWTVS